MIKLLQNMDEANTISYLIDILHFDGWLENKFGKHFGVKSDWARYLEPEKYHDKNLIDFIDFLVNSGILKETTKKGIFPIYRPDKESRIIAQMMIEKSNLMLKLETAYDMTRNESKGTFNL